MPFIDVSDLATDPDFAEVLTVYRRQMTMGSNGRPTITSTLISPAPVGVVIPQNDIPLQRGPDQQTLPRLIQVHTPYRLRSASKAGGQTYQPDQIVWQGDTFVVNRVHSFSSFGAGFIQADCSSVDSTEAAPV